MLMYFLPKGLVPINAFFAYIPVARSVCSIIPNTILYKLDKDELNLLEMASTLNPHTEITFKDNFKSKIISATVQ